MKVFDLPVHPAADIFPMLADDELDELAADIKANGLRYPLAVKDGVLIDGRNRREACKRAGVEPRVEELNGGDPIAYILSTNIARRHLSKGQRAMAIAKIYPEPSKRGRGNKSVISTDLNAGAVSHARTVLQWLPVVADAVLAGSKSLGEAYDEALREKKSHDSEMARYTRLVADAPDLASLVHEGRMRLAEAEAAHSARVNDAKRQRHNAIVLSDQLDELFEQLVGAHDRPWFIQFLQQPDDRAQLYARLERWHRAITQAMKEARHG